MSKYILYTYQFSPLQSQSTTLFRDTPQELFTPEQLMSQKQELFESFFTDTPIFKKGNQTYGHKIIAHQDHIIVFRIANNKRLLLEEEFHKQEYQYTPSCIVIVDNRKDVQRIAIEEDKVAFSDTDTAKRILLYSFARYLHKKGLDISILRDYDRSEFWDIIHKHENDIEMVRFHFTYPNLPHVSQTITDIVKSTSKSTNSKQSSLELKASKGESLKIEECNQDISELVDHSAESGDTIIIKARKIRGHIKTGTTTKSFEYDDLEVKLSGDLFSSGFDTLLDMLNKFPRL